VKKQVPVWPIAGIAIVIVAAIAYFMLIGPKRAEAGRLADKIADLETQVRTAKLAAQPKESAVQLKLAPLFELTKAMPDRDDVPGIILELNSIAQATGVRFKAIAPQDPVTQEGYRALPISLTFQGNYYDLTDFLFRLRNLVTVKEGVLEATGRLYTLDVLDLHEQPTERFPKIQAVLTISAYSFGAAPATAGVAPATTTPTATTTAAETTTGSTTTEPAPAAGAAATPGTGG
jgi:Tfp pilus assembly protein PilO